MFEPAFLPLLAQAVRPCHLKLRMVSPGCPVGQVAAGGLGSDPVTWAKGDALQGSPVAARAAFVSAFLGTNQLEQSQGGREGRGNGGTAGWGTGGFSCGREEEKWEPLCSMVTGVPGRPGGDFGVPRAGTVTMATAAASQAVTVTLVIESVHLQILTNNNDNKNNMEMLSGQGLGRGCSPLFHGEPHKEFQEQG